jgi:cytidylate kinase
VKSAVARVITLDGPAASGKTTVGRMLAARLGYLFFDTGVMYRAVALSALRRGVDVEDEEQVSALAEGLAIDVLPPAVDDGRAGTVLLDGIDVSRAVREPAVDAAVSKVSAYRRVRAAMAAQQRRIGLRGRVVMVGRDVGTVVLPEAELKIYLDAALDERARRRHRELAARRSSQSLEEVRKGLARRDEIDSSRELSPLRPAEDAVIIDTTALTPEEILQRIEPLLVE